VGDGGARVTTYRLQTIAGDGRVIQEQDIEALHIPKGGDLVIKLSRDMTQADFHEAAKMLREFFADRYRVLCVRSDIEFLRLVPVEAA
jgi:hypothetical protein